MADSTEITCHGSIAPQPAPKTSNRSTQQQSKKATQNTTRRYPIHLMGHRYELDGAREQLRDERSPNRLPTIRSDDPSSTKGQTDLTLEGAVSLKITENTEKCKGAPPAVNPAPKAQHPMRPESLDLQRAAFGQSSKSTILVPQHTMRVASLDPPHNESGLSARSTICMLAASQVPTVGQFPPRPLDTRSAPKRQHLHRPYSGKKLCLLTMLQLPNPWIATLFPQPI
ncbi:putative WD repeat-containing protein 62 [Sesbania bispinosa]|nr:putative WD repeat-containing protein 62 [Sesbania bispinosa]